MSESAYALRRALENLRRENAELRAALAASNAALMDANALLKVLKLPFLRRWRLRRYLARQKKDATVIRLAQASGHAGPGKAG